jgi:hypothetical protein
MSSNFSEGSNIELFAMKSLFCVQKKSFEFIDISYKFGTSILYYLNVEIKVIVDIKCIWLSKSLNNYQMNLGFHYEVFQIVDSNLK